MPDKSQTLALPQANSHILDSPIRVVVADDSPFMRKALTMLLQEDPNIDVVGVAKDGRECLDLVETLHPDILTLDLNMPLMNGVSVLRIIHHESPLPVIMISSLTVEGAEATMEALELGAVDFIAKQLTPKSLDIDIFKRELVSKVKWAVQRHRKIGRKSVAPKRRIFKVRDKERSPVEIVGIGASTGGPIALQKIIPMLPREFPVPVIVAQHIPSQFSQSLVSRLNARSQLTVREARHNDRLLAGEVLVAPGGMHLEVTSENRVRVFCGEKGELVCPSVNRLLSSMAETYGGGTLAVILTGMGNDGLEGSLAVQRRGGQVLVQDEATSLAYSMPKCVVDQGLADCEASLYLIASEILRML
jgi:two-component system chemotaxis response regulator CheB